MEEISRIDDTATNLCVQEFSTSTWLHKSWASKLKSHLEICLDLDILFCTFPNECDRLIVQFAPSVASTRTSLSSWIVGEDDVLLVHCAYRHGIGNWTALINDHSLRFTGNFWERYSESNLPNDGLMFSRLKEVLKNVKTACKEQGLLWKIQKPLISARMISPYVSVEREESFPAVLYKRASDGNPILPALVDFGLTLVDIGEIYLPKKDDPEILSKARLYPNGFHSRRLHRSVVPKHPHCEYDCRIEWIGKYI